MRKTLLLLLPLVLTATAAGASAVTAANSVTIALSRPAVVYGGTVKLSGSVSNQQSGETVTVLARPLGQSSLAALATAQTSSGGSWSYLAKPTIKTTYQARWKGATSRLVTVKVRPLITLKLVSLATGTFSTTATAARSFAGKFVLVQRLTSAGTLTLKKVTLGSASSATFRVRLHRGRSRLRVVMPTSQTAPGYITGYSKVLTVRR